MKPRGDCQPCAPTKPPATLHCMPFPSSRAAPAPHSRCRHRMPPAARAGPPPPQPAGAPERLAPAAQTANNKGGWKCRGNMCDRVGGCLAPAARTAKAGSTRLRCKQSQDEERPSIWAGTCTLGSFHLGANLLQTAASCAHQQHAAGINLGRRPGFGGVEHKAGDDNRCGERGTARPAARKEAMDGAQGAATASMVPVGSHPRCRLNSLKWAGQAEQAPDCRPAKGLPNKATSD